MTARDISEKLDYGSSSISSVIIHHLEGEWVNVKRFDGVGPYWKPSLYKVLPVNIPDYVVNR